MSTKATATLNDLIETLKDGEQGFRDAADNVSSPELRTLFTEYSQQRARFAGELQALAKSLGEPKPEDSASLASALHRGWMDLKAAITKRDDHAVLVECERGEDVAVAEFKKALAADLPSAVRATVEAQYDGVKAAHDRVRALRDEAG